MSDVGDRRGDVADVPSFRVSEPHEPAYARSPVAAIRLAGAIVLLAVLSVVVRRAATNSFSSDVADLLGTAPHWLVSVAVGVCQLGFLVPAALGFLAHVALRRFARIGRMMLAAVVCVGGLVLLQKIVGAAALPLIPGRHPGGPGTPLFSGYGIGASFPTTVDLGAIAAWMAVDRSHWSGRWRLVGRIVLVLGLVGHLGVTLANPARIATAVVMASAAAALVQLLVGAPSTRPRARTVGTILERLGYDIAAVERAGRFRGFIGFWVELADGAQLFVKVVGRDAWAVLLPVRLYRLARFRDVGQERPFRSLRSIVEHEALSSLKAHADGVPTPRLTVVAEFPPDAMLMAFEASARQRVSDIEPERRTPELADAAWSIVARLQRSHTVHGHVNADTLLVDDAGDVVLVEFGSASLGVVGPALSTDVAELLAATAAPLGPGSAVASAVAGIGPEAVAAALPRLQPLALTPRTRAAVKAAGCLDELRDEVQRATGAAPAAIAELERIKVRTVVSLAMAGLALWTLIPQLVGMSTVWGELRHANWWWAVAALAMSAITYVGAAVSLDGSLPERLPLAPNIGVHLATSFVAVAAPGGALALTTRFLQKRGIDTPSAVAAVGVDLVAGGIVHVTLTGLFLALAGTSGLKTFALPSLGPLGLAAAAIVAIGAVVLALPWTRAQLRTRVLPATKRSMASVGEIARQPGTMIELFGGSLAITLGYLLALEVSVAAFGTAPAFTSVAIVYLIGTAISSVAPTPGGIGAVEATLIAGLTSAGMPGTTAVAAVILFRLVTFWIPLLPGWGMLTVMQRSGSV